MVHHFYPSVLRKCVNRLCDCVAAVMQSKHKHKNTNTHTHTHTHTHNNTDTKYRLILPIVIYTSSKNLGTYSLISIGAKIKMIIKKSLISKALLAGGLKIDNKIGINKYAVICGNRVQNYYFFILFYFFFALVGESLACTYRILIEKSQKKK